ncbi:MAG: MotA/TolQ/ExbB proton channel family protein [Verrucomicrobiota bacterium]
MMWPLLLCSLVALTFILERAWAYWRAGSFHKEDLATRAWECLASLDKDGWNQWTESKCPILRLYAFYASYASHELSIREEAIKRKGDSLLAELRKNLRIIATISQVAPMLGLLGTVTGLVATFHKMQELGTKVQPSDLAGGIWEALLTTIVGMVIGILCIIAYQIFQSRVDLLARTMKTSISFLEEQRHFIYEQAESSSELASNSLSKKEPA